MDIDNLKEVNDMLGHSTGDALLKSFAGILMLVFGDCEFVGRMGGDEFMAVITGEMVDDVPGLIEELQKKIDESNSSKQNFEYSISYGTASSDDIDYGRRVFDLYMLADKRMYEMKNRRREEELISYEK